MKKHAIIQRNLFIACGALALAACSGGGVGGNGLSFGGGSGGGSGGATPSVSVAAFSVAGTDGHTVNGGGSTPVVVDGNQNGGSFVVNWSAPISNDIGTGERMALFLGDAPSGTDTGTGDGTGHAVQIMGQNCDMGEFTNDACPTTTASVPCQFSESSMQMICPDNQSGVFGDTVNISQWLANHGGLPGTYYLTLQACVFDASANSHCDTQTLPVNLN